MIGVEMVEDKATNTPLVAEKMLQIWEDCKDMGVLLGKGGLNGNVFRIKVSYINHVVKFLDIFDSLPPSWLLF